MEAKVLSVLAALLLLATSAAGFASTSEPWVCGGFVPGSETHIYVAMSGTDSATCGDSPAAACATVSQGIARCAGKAGCDVLVEWGQYKLTAPVNLAAGINVYGGCLEARRAKPEDVSLLIAHPGQPAVISASNGAKIIRGFEILGSDHPGSHGEASVTMRIADPTTVLDCRIVAAKGAKGAPGGDGHDGTRGGDSNGFFGGNNPDCLWAFGGNVTEPDNTTGPVKRPGEHGDCFPRAGCWDAYGGPGDLTGVSRAVQGKRGVDDRVSCNYGGNGHKGEDGKNADCGQGGRAATTIAGSFSAGQIAGSSGESGEPGHHGGGGAAGGYGGNGGTWCGSGTGGQGGGGGAGGCGGTAGGGGQQGGASIGILVIGTTLEIRDSRVVGGRGGDGGKGGAGGRGGLGGSGAGGARPLYNGWGGSGGPGGHGGIGGAAGGGAGGNGGPSIGIAIAAGGAVQESGVIYLPGASGVPGTHGTGGGAVVDGACGGKNGADGINGAVTAKQTY